MIFSWFNALKVEYSFYSGMLALLMNHVKINATNRIQGSKIAEVYRKVSNSTNNPQYQSIIQN
jgi:hypothetical protein